MAREYTCDELVKALRKDGPRLVGQFFRPCPDLEDLIRRSVSGNTFRSFRKLARPPSVVFREWASSRLPSRIASMAAISDQTQYVQHLEEHAADLTRYWLAEGEKELPFGPGRKLVDLLFKGVVRHVDIPDAERQRLIKFLHVPLDSYSLLAVRECAGSGEFGSPITIPPNAKMGFVTSAEQYNRLQLMMRQVATVAGVAPICIDLVAWDLAHGL